MLQMARLYRIVAISRLLSGVGLDDDIGKNLMLNVAEREKWIRRLLFSYRKACCAAVFSCVVVPLTAQERAPESSYEPGSYVDGRLDIPSRTVPLKLAEENELVVLLHGYKVHTAIARFSYFDLAGNPLGTGGESEVTLKYRSDGTAYVSIVPERIGKAKLHIDVWFEDGVAQTAVTDTEVVFPDHRPEKFLVVRGGGFSQTQGTVYMDLSELSNHSGLGPMAVYPGNEHPVPIPAQAVRFKLIAANENDPPITLDDTSGRITALHIGHALVESTFEGFSDLTCVDVMENSSDGGNRTNCSELVPPGRTVPSSGIEGKKPPSKVKVIAQP